MRNIPSCPKTIVLNCDFMSKSSVSVTCHGKNSDEYVSQGNVKEHDPASLPPESLSNVPMVGEGKFLTFQLYQCTFLLRGSRGQWCCQ